MLSDKLVIMQQHSRARKGELGLESSPTVQIHVTLGDTLNEDSQAHLGGFCAWPRRHVGLKLAHVLLTKLSCLALSLNLPGRRSTLL